jgi:hypothetical protein
MASQISRIITPELRIGTALDGLNVTRQAGVCIVGCLTQRFYFAMYFILAPYTNLIIFVDTKRVLLISLEIIQLNWSPEEEKQIEEGEFSLHMFESEWVLPLSEVLILIIIVNKSSLSCTNTEFEKRG